MEVEVLLMESVVLSVDQERLQHPDSLAPPLQDLLIPVVQRKGRRVTQEMVSEVLEDLTRVSHLTPRAVKNPKTD